MKVVTPDQVVRGEITARELVHQCFRENWDMMRKVKEAGDNDTVTLQLVSHFVIPAKIAKALLAEHLAKELGK